ncbi:MAG: carboxypeptidase regulatory-like domain-containing protein, partial [Caldilineaceae bacterium]|nr:carboxypeptidase regulatory-like domain-containing protein [Caldilineaceae bacterium]
MITPPLSNITMHPSPGTVFADTTEVRRNEHGHWPKCKHHWLFLLGLALVFTLTACKPAPAANVLGYLLTERSGRLTATYEGPRGALTGTVRVAGEPLAGATVLVAERSGLVHSAKTDNTGIYQIAEIPPGRYVPAAVAPGHAEAQLESALGNPVLVQIRANEVTEAPPIALQPLQTPTLPDDLANAVSLQLTATAVVTTPFPAGSTATVQAFQFTYAGGVVDTLRLYLPTTTATNPTVTTPLPLLFMIYPTATDAWQSISVAYAAQGYALLAISPIAQRALDIDAHAADARVALALAQQGALSDRVEAGPVVALGGSFSSAILHRFLRSNAQRDPAQRVAGWVTVGGITDAFAGTHAFYAGTITIPPEYEYLIPALGAPNLYPLAFLRYSPVYTASELPPTLIIHTDADTIIPIAQAYALED